MGNKNTYNLVLMASTHVSRMYNLPSNYLDYREHPAALIHNLDFHLTEPQLHLFLINGLNAYHRALDIRELTKRSTYLKEKVKTLADLLLPHIDRIGSSDEDAYNILLTRLTMMSASDRKRCSETNPMDLFPTSTQILLQVLDESLDKLNTECGRIKLEAPLHCHHASLHKHATLPLPCSSPKRRASTPHHPITSNRTMEAAYTLSGQEQYYQNSLENPEATCPEPERIEQPESTPIVIADLSDGTEDNDEDEPCGGEETLDLSHSPLPSLKSKSLDEYSSDSPSEFESPTSSSTSQSPHPMSQNEIL